jgi:hypothetical protein
MSILHKRPNEALVELWYCIIVQVNRIGQFLDPPSLEIGVKKQEFSVEPKMAI